jgi:TM2 domain-containing membrane protein YozV
MFCSNCGKEIDDKAVVCVGCGVATPKNATANKEWLTTLLLCLFLGGFGGHRFYVGDTKGGIWLLVLVYILSWFTFGITAIVAGVIVLIDLINILTGKFKLPNGEYLTK